MRTDADWRHPYPDVVTSQPPPDAPRPPLTGLMNAPLQWGSATWGAYVWDFLVNETPRKRNEILLHELFHAVQPQFGLAVPALASEHLDALDDAAGRASSGALLRER